MPNQVVCEYAADAVTTAIIESCRLTVTSYEPFYYAAAIVGGVSIMGGFLAYASHLTVRKIQKKWPDDGLVTWD